MSKPHTLDTTPTPTVFSQAKSLASLNDLSALDALWSTVCASDRQHVADVALIGASEAKAKEACQWALKHGACELWGIQQEADTWKRVGKDSNRSLRMLGGPGEVSKGTFMSSSSSSSSASSKK